MNVRNARRRRYGSLWLESSGRLKRSAFLESSAKILFALRSFFDFFFFCDAAADVGVVVGGGMDNGVFVEYVVRAIDIGAVVDGVVAPLYVGVAAGFLSPSLSVFESLELELDELDEDDEDDSSSASS
jgi:hypothetical protein